MSLALRWLVLILFSAPLFLIAADRSDEAAPAPGAAPAAQSSAKSDAPGIQDNSFMVEEAYNQEDGVVQHINTFQWLSQRRNWTYTETDEWPVRSRKHQLSMSLGGTHAGSFPGSGGGLSDTALNYRYQLVGSGETKVAMAPRLTLLLPTGDSKFGRGSGGTGYQASIPVSVQLNQWLVTHWNAGATWVPHARNEANEGARTVGVNLGQSFVWLAKKRFNVLVETVWISSESVIGRGRTDRSHDLFINPGIRWAYNFKNGLQIVPGLAMPIGVGPSAGEKGAFLYLSFEHPFAPAHSRQK